MKNKSALRQSGQSVRFLLVACPIAWLVWFWLRWWALLIPAGMLTFTLIGDCVNIWYIRRRARLDPNFMDRRV